MRLGISKGLKHSTAVEWAEAQVALGCRSVVFPLNCEAPRELVDEYAAEAKKHDLLIAEVGIWRNAIAADEAERKANLEYSIGQLRLADYIGARCCVNVAGACGARWDGGYRENFSKEMRDRTVGMIRTIIDEAAPSDTYFTLEPMPWMIPTSPEDYLRLMEEVDRDRFAVHMDIINMINAPDRYFFAGEFLEKTFSLLGDRIRSCHLKDVQLKQEYTFQLRECACGEGSFPLEKYAELAHKANPDMPMIIEHLGSDEEYAASMEYVKKRLAAWVS